ncbi:peroxin 26 [Cladophialophora carrionii]|uniref:Peroxin 26 n=1 Tax=Cladophialophora carrionii TaxID=86049 RepID=A0A1C1CM04_9EURO|nr:peroxin 26 [Cladophialophora carrionii]
MSIGTDSQSSSRDLSSSISSLNQSSKRTSSEISKVYKHASQLFLTRRLLESYEALQPVITPPSQSRPDDSPALAPIATATTSQRIKIWSLYVTLLNSIVDLGDAEGRETFGSKEYKELKRRVQNGDVWEQVVRDGYQGREGSVDAEVVYNLSNLLLGQAPNQQLNQSRLETYFSSSSHPTLEVGQLDLSTHLDRALSNGQQSSTGLNGTNTPKDLTSRIKVLEIFTLHVLPRNSEWDYARSFIQNSDILDEERREAFLQTLEELQDVTRRESIDAGDGQEEVFEDTEEHPTEDAPNSQQQQSQSPKATSKHQRTSSEVDYGIERAHPNGGTHTTAPSRPEKPLTEPTATPKIPQPTSTPKSPPPPSATPTRSHLSPPAQTPRRPAQRKSPKSASSQNTLAAQARALFQALSNLARSMATTLQKNPTAMLRFLLFVLMFVVVAGQKHIREKAKRVLGRGWEKLRSTVGMGVKVSYI